MIRLRHETLPAGLCALVRRRGDGDLEVIVSSALSAGRRRAAVRAGLRAIRPARRSTGWLPVPALITLALAGSWLRVVGRLIRLHLAASVAVAATATTAAVVIAVTPPLLHGSPGGGRSPAGGALAPQPGPTAGLSAPARGRATPSSAAVAQPPPSAVPVAAGSLIGPAATPTPQQQTTSAPAPSPSATGGSGGICLVLLGIWVCL